MQQALATPHVTHPFVHYADFFSQQDETRTLLEQLEEKHGLNPNLIVFFIWFSQSERGRLSTRYIKAILDNLCSWHERVFSTLEQLKTRINTEQHNNLAKMKRLLAPELALAGQIEQCLIADTLLKTEVAKRSALQQLVDSCHTIVNYCKLIGVCLDAADWTTIGALLQSAFPGLAPEAVKNACQQAESRCKSKSARQSEQLSFISF